MAKTRMINTRFWDDNYTSNLDPIEKLMFLYILTNTSTNISGVYEIPLKKIANETGIDKEMVVKILDRFERDDKVFYTEGWMCIKNFIKNQNQKSPKVKKGIQVELEAVPSHISDKLIGYGYGMYTLSHSNTNTNTNSNLVREENFSEKIIPSSKTLSNFRDQRRAESGREPMAKKIATPEQKKVLARLDILDRYHEKALEYGFNYLEEEDEQANNKYQGLSRPFIKRYKTEKEQDEVMEWFFTDQSMSYANGHPSNFFSVSTWLSFDNRKNKKGGVVSV